MCCVAISSTSLDKNLVEKKNKSRNKQIKKKKLTRSVSSKQ